MAGNGEKKIKLLRIAGRLRGARELNLIVIIAVVSAVINIFQPTFLTLYNVQVISRQLAVFGLLSIAQTFVIIVLGIDLSVGSIVAFTGIITAMVFAATENVVLAVGAALGFALLIGFYHGILVTKVKMAPFVVTLGSLSIFRGLSFVLSRGYPILIRSPRIQWFGQGLIGPFPVPVVILFAVVVYTVFILHFSKLGRYIYTIGGNPVAARMSGVPVNAVIIYVYCQATLLASIVGLIVAGRMAQGLASVAAGYELTAVAGAVIGGTSFLGGQGTVIGTVFGALVMSMIGNVLITLRVDAYWYNLVTGLIIIVVVAADTLLAKRPKRT